MSLILIYGLLPNVCTSQDFCPHREYLSIHLPFIFLISPFRMVGHFIIMTMAAYIFYKVIICTKKEGNNYGSVTGCFPPRLGFLSFAS